MIILDHVLKPDIGPVVLGNMIKLKDILSEKFDSNFLSESMFPNILLNETVLKKDLNKEILGVIGKEDTSKIISSDKFPMHPPLYRKFGLKPGKWINWRYSINSKDLFFWTKYVEEKYSKPVQLHLKSKGVDILRVTSMKSFQYDDEPSYEKDKAKYMVNEAVHPAVRWVGAVKHDGAVILPPNQSGDRQHYHYGLDGHQYRFSYWPYKKEVSWWNFPSEEEELAVKVEDYLIRRGYAVDRHVDFTGLKIRDSLNERSFKKIAEITLMNDEIPEKLYHATYRPLLEEILSGGIVPGGSNIQNFDWAGKFVYLAETVENAISFVEVSENEDIPEEWFGDIVVLEVDVSKLDLTKMMPDENWNPATAEGEEGYRSFQYEGVVSPDSITVL